MKGPRRGDMRAVRRRQKLELFAQTLRTAARAFEEVVETMITAATDYLEAIEADPIGPEVTARPEDELLTREQAAKRLGIGATTLTKLLEGRHLHATRMPGAKGERDIVRFSAIAIDEFKRAHTTKDL